MGSPSPQIDEGGIRYKGYSYGDAPGVQLSHDHVSICVAGTTIRSHIFEELYRSVKAGVFVDVQIVEHVALQPESPCPIQRSERTPEKHKSTVDRVKRMLFDVGFNIKHIRELSIPSGSRVAHEVETGDLYRDRRRADKNRRIHKIRHRRGRADNFRRPCARPSVALHDFHDQLVAVRSDTGVFLKKSAARIKNPITASNVHPSVTITGQFRMETTVKGELFPARSARTQENEMIAPTVDVLRTQ
ncbi:hypothetical protein CCUS01_11223 [Colletotrichum cuscutae]|uniref:Uncharacterized protein n=1 Tax=Colletotrichum cuscutae TaxID=1209917 RepID=A0AAI9XK79_9PEZI|nr:hypothetical protein CCUS01_11223 [Colletotrichum cuscutae]